MRQNMRDGAMMQLRTGAVVFVFALILSFFLGLGLSRSVAALPLVDDRILRTVVQPLKQRLQDNNNKQTGSATGNQPSNGNASAKSAVYQSPATTTSLKSVTPPSEPVIEPLPAVTPIDVSDMPPLTTELRGSRPSLPKVTLAKATHLSTMPIQATENGWILFGVAWYWWVILAVAIFYGARQVVISRSNFKTSLIPR
jgi:hypothetical protein